MGGKGKGMDEIPLTIEVPDAVLGDLHRRLEATRWPGEIPGSDWDYGTNLGYLQELVAYWRTRFDWRAQEKRINAFHHYKATVEGLGIHFIHEKGQGSSPMPLVITHGWPGSFFEMHKILPLLTDPGSHGGDPADAFDVVVPSMPGYGRFVAQGGDWGASVTCYLGFAHPQHLIGIHTTSMTRPTPYLGPGSSP